MTPLPAIMELGEAFSLYFDGAYQRKEGKASAGIVAFNLAGKKVLERGVSLPRVSSNNEAEYAILEVGLQSCLN